MISKLSIVILIVLCFMSGVLYAQEPKTPQEAITFFTAIIQNNPDSAADGYYGRGLAYRDTGNLKQAITDLSKAIEINPNYTQVYLDRGIIYYDMGRFNEAIADYAQVIKIDPNNIDAYNNRGNAYNNKEMPDQAILDFNKALEINPNYDAAYYGRATSYYYKNQYDRSWDDLNKAESLGLKAPPQLRQALRAATGRVK